LKPKINVVLFINEMYYVHSKPKTCLLFVNNFKKNLPKLTLPIDDGFYKLSQNCHPFDQLRAGSERSEGSGRHK